MCSYWSVSRQAYYKERTNKQINEEKAEKLLCEVRLARRTQSKLGSRKLFGELSHEIRKCGRGFGRDKFFDLLRSHDLLVKRKRKFAITTQSDHPFYKYKNVLAEAEITAPHQAWVSDITYLRTRHGFVYLSLVTDVYSRKIVGWNIDHSLGVESTLKAAIQAMGQCKQLRDVIHHSDRGIQYCCYAYTNKLKDNGIRVSMGEAGNCYDNAIAERVNGILKGEYQLDAEFLNIKHARQVANEAIYLYNYKRPHWSLGLQKPAEVHAGNCRPIVKRRWGRLPSKEQAAASF